MARQPEPQRTVQNRILAALPPRELERLLPRMQRVPIKLHQVVHEPVGLFTEVYFPEEGLISVVTSMDDGSTIEVATVGNEGLAGLPVLMGIEKVPQRYLVQIEGQAMRMRADTLWQETREDTPLRRLLMRYQTAFFSQIMQSVACNGLHNIQQRCCLWLLRCLDRSRSSEVVITHEFLGQMLGVRRASVTEVLKPLHAKGWIGHRRGVVSVLDRQGLERVTCECYQVVRNEFDRMLSGAV
ncbi:MAG: Crp/Fnr family transcriptional regulator [Pirellulaceae bacterium]